VLHVLLVDLARTRRGVVADQNSTPHLLLQARNSSTTPRPMLSAGIASYDLEFLFHSIRQAARTLLAPAVFDFTSSLRGGYLSGSTVVYLARLLHLLDVRFSPTADTFN
jgi:hypothetical protein